MILITISVNLLGGRPFFGAAFFIVFYKEYCHVYTITLSLPYSSKTIPFTFKNPLYLLVSFIISESSINFVFVNF